MCLAIPGKILDAVDAGRHLAIVEVMGVRRKVDLALIEDQRPVRGDWVLIHVGFAMNKISEADALETLRMLESLGETEAAVTEAEGYGLGGPPP